MVELVQRAIEHHGIEDRTRGGGMLVGVSAVSVYGFAGRSRSKEPSELVFRVEREGLTAKVHQRVNGGLEVTAPSASSSGLPEGRDSGPDRVGPEGLGVVALGSHGAGQRAARVLAGVDAVEHVAEVVARGPAQLRARV